MPHHPHPRLPSFDDLLASVGQLRDPKEIPWTAPPRATVPVPMPHSALSTPPDSLPSSYTPLRSTSSTTSPSTLSTPPPNATAPGEPRSPSASGEMCEHYQDRIKLLRKQSIQSLDCDIPMPSGSARPHHLRSHSHPTALPRSSDGIRAHGFQYPCYLPPPPHHSSPIKFHPPHHSPLALVSQDQHSTRRFRSPSVPFSTSTEYRAGTIHPNARLSNCDSGVSTSSAASLDPYDRPYEVCDGLGRSKSSGREMMIPRLPGF